MKFRVVKTSMDYMDDPSGKTYADGRGVKRPVQVPVDLPPTSVCVRCDGGWGLEVATLEELVAFVNEVGVVVFTPSDPPELEIYNDYRE